jgi:hypothetical protein
VDRCTNLFILGGELYRCQRDVHDAKENCDVLVGGNIVHVWTRSNLLRFIHASTDSATHAVDGA